MGSNFFEVLRRQRSPLDPLSPVDDLSSENSLYGDPLASANDLYTPAILSPTSMPVLQSAARKKVAAEPEEESLISRLTSGRGLGAMAARLGGPLAGGVLGSLVGGPVGAVIGAGIGGAGGEYGAENIEGSPISPTDIAVSGALSALPAGPFARLAAGKALVPRLALSAAEGASQGALDVLARTGLEQQRLPTGEELGGAVLGGAVLGAPFGFLPHGHPEAQKAQRYEEAATSGANDLLRRGLGRMVEQGVITEERAAQVLERSVAESLGEPTPEIHVPPIEEPPAPAPMAPEGASATLPGVTGLVPEAAPTPVPEGAGAPGVVGVARKAYDSGGYTSALDAAQRTGMSPEQAAILAGHVEREALTGAREPVEGLPPGTPVEAPPAPPVRPVRGEGVPLEPAPLNLAPPEAPPAPVVAPTTPEIPPPVARPAAPRIRVEQTPKVVEQVAAIANAKAESGEHLTKRDLLEAGLVTPKQAKSHSLENLLDALGAGDVRARLEHVPGFGFRVRPEEALGGAMPSAPEALQLAGLPAPEAGAVEAGGKPAPPTPPSEAKIPSPGEFLQGSGLGAEIVRLFNEGRSYREIAQALAEHEPMVAQAAQIFNYGKKGGRWQKVRDSKSPAPFIERAAQMLVHKAGLKKPELPEAAIARIGAPEIHEAARARVEALPSGEEVAAALGGLREPTGLKERAPVRPIHTPEALRTAQQELADIRGAVEFQPLPNDHPLLARADELEDAIAGARERGVERAAPEVPSAQEYYPAREQAPLVRVNPPMEAPARAPRPEPPEPFQGTVEPVTERTAPRPAYTSTEEGQFEGANRPITTRPPAEPITTTRDAVGRFIKTTDADPKVFTGTAEMVLGKSLEDATSDELNTVLSLAEREPDLFGASPPKLDPTTTAQATARLAGTTQHLGQGVTREFRYDPASPAGAVQNYAIHLESRFGLPAEENLQRTMTRWLQNLSSDPNVILQRAGARAEMVVQKGLQAAAKLEAAGDAAGSAKLRGELATQVQNIAARAQQRFASAQNLRRLLLEAPEDEARVELTKLLRRDLLNDARNHIASPGAKVAPIDDMIARSARENLTPEERDRLAITPKEEPTETAAPDPHAQVKAIVEALPTKPEGMSGKAWMARVQTDPTLLRKYQEALKGITEVWSANRVAFRAKGAPWTPVLRQIADDLGFKIDSKRGAEKFIQTVGIALRQPDAALAGVEKPLLTNQLVAERGAQWERAVSEGVPTGESGARTVDLEGDAPYTTGLARAIAPVSDTLARLTDDIANTLGLTSRFGGFVGSPQLHGVRINDAIYTNPLRALHEAQGELTGSTLQGTALADALHYKTAQNITDNIIHEAAHYKARHDAATGDIDFVDAYAGALRELSARYPEIIREVRDAIAPGFGQLEALMPQFTGSLERLNAQRNAVRTPGVGLGAGEGGAPTLAAGPGGGARGAAYGGEAGARPGEPVRGGAAEQAGGLGAPAAALEGGAERVPQEQGGEPGVALQKQRTIRTLQSVGQLFAQNFAKYAGTPEDADAVLREIAAGIAHLERAKLVTAKPQGAVDIGLNLNKLEGLSDEQKAGLALALQARNEMYSRATPMKWSDVDADMRDILKAYTPEEFVAFSKRTGLRDPADFALLRTVAATYGQDVDAARAALRAAEISGDTVGATRAKDELAAAAVRRMAAIDTLIPETTRVARILAFQRMMVHPLDADETFKSRFFGAMRSAKIDDEKAKGLYSMLQDTMKEGPAADWNRFTQAFREATQVKAFDKFLEFWKAGLLGLPTQVANVGSNALFAGFRAAEKGISVLANNFLSGLTGAPKKRFVGEIGARASNGTHGFAEAAGNLGKDLWDIIRLQTPDVKRRLESGTFYDEPDLRQLYGAIGGKTGEFVRMPFKMLDAFDNFFKHLARSQEYGAQAYRLANDSRLRSPGESVDNAYGRIIGELRRAAGSPVTEYKLFKKYSADTEKMGYGNIFNIAREAAQEDTFQKPLGETMRKIYQGTQAHPSLQLIFPFVKTPYNIIGEALKRTPLGAIWAINEFKNGRIASPELVENTVKSALGTSLMALTANAALNGSITGGGPADPKEAQILRRTGWQPYSFKIGDQYYSYSRMAPFSTILGTAADMAEAWNRKDIATGSELLQKGVESVSNNVTNQSFLQGLENITKIISDPQKDGLSAIRQLQASLVPNIIGVVPFAHAARAIDPNYRETEAFTLSPFIAQTPFLSQTLEPQRTPTGEVRERTGTPAERLFSPFLRSQEQTGPIAESAAEIARLGVGVEAPAPYFRVGKERVYFTPEERQEIAQAQERAMEKIANVIRRGDYQRAPDDDTLAGGTGVTTKRDLILRTLNRYRSPVLERAKREALKRAQDKEYA